MLPIRRHLQSDGASDVSHNNGTLTVGPDPDVTSSACVSEIPSPHQKEYVNHDSTPDDIVSQVGTEIHPGSSVSCTNNEQRRQVSYPMQADFGDAEFIEDTDEDTNALSSEQGLEVVDPHSQPIVFRSIVPFDFLVPRSLIRLSWSLWNQKWQPWLSSSSLELFIARWEHSETDSLDCENNRERPFRIENGRWISTTPVIRVQITSAKRHFKCTLIDSKLAAKEATFEEEFMSYEIKTWIPAPLENIDDESSLDTHFRTLTVNRRFSDFEFLERKLESVFPRKLFILPPLPPKSILSRFDHEALFERMQGLQVYLEDLVSHPLVKSSQIFSLFLGSDAIMRDEVRESSFPQMQIIHASVIDIEGHCMTPDDSIWRKERSEYHINQEASPSSLSPENAVFSDYTLRHAEHLIEKKMRLQICIPDKLNEIHRGQQIIGAHYGTLADAIQSLDQSCLTIDRGGWRRVSRLIAGMKDVLEEQPDATVDPILSSANYLPIGMITSLKQWQSITLQAPGMAEEIGRIVEAESLRAETIHNGKMRLAMKTWIQCQIKKQQALLCQLLEASDILESNHLF